MSRLKIALTKGRIEEQALPLLEAAGIEGRGLRDKGRRLIFDEDPRFEIILVKGADVLTYLESDSVQAGIVGSDVLDERGEHGFATLDLGIGVCRFVLASTRDFDPRMPRRKIIATKYPRIAREYFRSIGEDVEIVRIEGSVELAPRVGLADAIVDISQTGNTLRENDLQVYANLRPVSAKLVIGGLALRQHREELRALVGALSAAG